MCVFILYVFLLLFVVLRVYFLCCAGIRQGKFPFPFSFVFVICICWLCVLSSVPVIFCCVCASGGLYCRLLFSFSFKPAPTLRVPLSFCFCVRSLFFVQFQYQHQRKKHFSCSLALVENHDQTNISVT